MLSERREPDGTLETALFFAERGIHVLPCRYGKKTPKTKHGVKDSSVDPLQIREWFSGKQVNLAVRCGTISSILIIDVDPRNGGVESLRRLIDANGSLSQDRMPTVLTGGGGIHGFVEAPGFPVRKKGLAGGVDMLGENRYAISVTSLHESGNYYMWKPGFSLRDTRIPQAADWVLENLQDRHSAAKRSNMLSNTVIFDGHRNNYLIAYIGQKIAQGLSERETELLALARNEEVCVPPKSKSEVLKTVRCAIRKYCKAGLSGNRFVPMVYVHELMMPQSVITYRGVTYRFSNDLDRYEVWDTQGIKRTVYDLSQKSLTPKQINVVVDYLRLETHSERSSQDDGIHEQEFISQCLEISIGSRTYLKNIFAAYEAWGQRHDLRTISQTDIRKLIESDTGIPCRRLTGGAYGFDGLRLIKE
ncbi:bifunctional DNA primase/polymerase [Thermodesulfobacteriota bacterium]